MKAIALILAWALLAICAALPSFGQVTAEQLASTPIRAEKVADNLHVLFGVGGNIAVQTGEQGVLIVDTQFPEMVPKYRAAIGELGGDGIDFAINTHWHYDHADGNQRLGPEGVWIVSQANSRSMLLKDNVINTISRPPNPQPAYPPAALPMATFDDRMEIFFNGERIDLMHFGPAHTTGDAAVFFRGQNAVHMGDVFNNAGYPFIDSDNGGDLDGMIAFCEAALEELEPGATVIPGHGAIATYEDLERYIAMLKSVRGKMAALVAQGATLEQVIAAKPTAEWDERYGDPTRMVNRSYAALTRRR